MAKVTWCRGWGPGPPHPCQGAAGSPRLCRGSDPAQTARLTGGVSSYLADKVHLKVKGLRPDGLVVTALLD